MTEPFQVIDIDAGRGLQAVAFSASGEHVVTGDGQNVRVWRTEDGGQTTKMGTPGATVSCLAVSKDGKWIAAGASPEKVFIWDAKTYEQVLAHRFDQTGSVTGSVTAVDFSPDSKRLVSASRNTATIWDVATRQQLRHVLSHFGPVRAAKYSPQGGRLATVTRERIHVWDSNDYHLLVKVEVGAINARGGLLWSNNHLFVVSDNKIKQFDALTGSVVAQWSVPDKTILSSNAPLQCGNFIVSATRTKAMFWDPSRTTDLALIPHSQDIGLIAFSSDERFLAIAGKDGKISVKDLPRFIDSTALPRLHRTLQEPILEIDNTILESWKHDRLDTTDTLLTTAIEASTNPSDHVLASRALLRARLKRWDEALEDAKKAIAIRPSIISFIAKSVAYVGKGEKDMAYRTCDIAFEHFHTSHVTLFLLIKAIIVFMAGEHHDAISRVDDLIAIVHFNSAYMYLLLGTLQMERNDYNDAVRSFERAQGQIRHYWGRPLLVISLMTGWEYDDFDLRIRRRLCAALHSAGRTDDAGQLLLQIAGTSSSKGCTDETNAKWVAKFTRRYLSTPERDSDSASEAARRDATTTCHTTLISQTTITVLEVWARSSLMSGSWEDTLVAATGFVVPRFTIYRAVCERLDQIDQTLDASKCFRKMLNRLDEEVNACNEKVTWVLDFKHRCLEKLESLGSDMMNTGRYHDAIPYYSAALALDPTEPQVFLVRRSKAHLAGGSWGAALNDANKAINLDPLSPWGYERKHAALHKAGEYESAINAFEVMLSKISQSSDPEILQCRHQYISPRESKVAIRKAVESAIRDLPRVLINTISGRLLDKSQQAAIFESRPVFNKLVSSTTTCIDHARINRAITQYYRYAMLSHRWEDNEPLFEPVIRMVVYDLDSSPTHDKLKMFCKVVRDADLHWAWSDTCCINKADHFVLQEALVAMFKWYQGSALTLVLLRGVRSPSRHGDLIRSIWNTRAWTFQEYHASKVVLFYNEDWTLYRNIDVPNHKESSAIITEMEEATGISARALMALRPGQDAIREKLCLASTRQTTLVEDAAYSLLGIFSMSLPVVYGEGDQALGRLLAQLLTSSGDTSILAWTGRSGSFNSCLPANITVFRNLPTSHIPSAMTRREMESALSQMRPFSLNLTLATKLLDRLHELPVPSFAGQRMKLPCLAFKLGPVSSVSGRVFRAKTDALGTVEMRTTEDLSRLDSLILVYPWIDFLLDRQPVGVIEKTGDHAPSTREPDTSPSPSYSTLPATQLPLARFAFRLGLPFGIRSRDTASLVSPVPVSPTDKRTEGLRLVIRLRQPFGALLFTPTRQNVAEYRRVASESLITVRVLEDTPLGILVASAQMLDVL